MEKFTIKDIPQNERPRERLYKYGAEVLTDDELLAIILRCGTSKENVLFLSKRIVSYFKTLDNLLNASKKELMDINGIKEAKAAQILAICELVKRVNLQSEKQTKISSPSDAASLVMNKMMHLKQEILKVLLLNKKNIIIGERDVFKGSLDSSIVHPREIFNLAIKNSAASIIICHNHPSGDSTPSKEDVNITLRIKECGNIIGIELLDHLIVGNNNYVSLKEKGII
ncbi:UPF0758 protein [Clostridium sp. TW13]|uniref:UPF0758 protein n=2 Tax=Inconstantimicrobium mannanitabidum TaxID=1604901 RepID=A0ACB5R7F3_9CLOT|nr:UPF0758 protein [Clostridium sp. TW13]